MQVNVKMEITWMAQMGQRLGGWWLLLTGKLWGRGREWGPWSSMCRGVGIISRTSHAFGGHDCERVLRDTQKVCLSFYEE